MDFLTLEYVLWATALGGLSAVSLPLGSAVGLTTRLRPVFISMPGAFGAGALLAALSVELVAPTLFALKDPGGSGHGDPYRNFYSLIVGAVMGGVLYFMLDQLVNAHGGFLRRAATSITYFRKARQADGREMVEKRRSSRCC